MAELNLQNDVGKVNLPGKATLRDWASMARLPNVPTVWSNVFTAWVLGWFFPAPDYRWRDLAWMLFGASLIYAGGAIYSEVFDVEFDRRNRPERPLPAGRIPRWLAAMAGLIFILTGGVLMWVGSAFRQQIAILLGVVLSYSVLHKRSPWMAVPLMGLCRATLVYVVLWAWRPALYDDVFKDELGVWAWAYIIALGVYVSSLSWIALGEMKAWRRKSVGFMLAGMPLVDAIFLVPGAGITWLLVPLACMGLAIGLRKIASAT